MGKSARLLAQGTPASLGAALFPSPAGRGFKVRDLIQRAFLARLKILLLLRKHTERRHVGSGEEALHKGGPNQNLESRPKKIVR